LAVYQKFQPFVENLAEKVFNLQTDTIRVMLTLTAPSVAHSTKANLTEISVANGYSAMAATVSTSVQVTGTYKWVLADVTWTATGGSIADFRYAAIYSDTAASDELIGFYDYGTTLTITVGNSFTVDFDASAGVFTLA
jgi:hypothetical protein